MALESVGRRSNGEIPNESDLNELLDALVMLLGTNGLPSTVLQWPVTAQSVLDMNGFSIINATTVSGIIDVNDGRSLVDAVSIVNAAGGGVIQIEPQFVAETSTGGITISADNVTILGGGGATINLTNPSAPTDCITVSGDNCTIRGINFTNTGGGSNILAAVLANAAANFVFEDNFLSLCTGAVQVGLSGASRCFNPRVANNNFSAHNTNCIELRSVESPVVTENHLTSLLASMTGIDIGAGSSGTQEAGVITNNTIQGADPTTHGITGTSSGGILDSWTIEGNAVKVTGTAFQVDGLTNSSVTGNSFSGDVYVSGVDTQYVSNYMGDLINLTGSIRATINSNNADGAIVSLSGASAAVIVGNTFQNRVSISAGVTIFVANSVNSDLSGMTTPAVYANNNVSGSET